MNGVDPLNRPVTSGPRSTVAMAMQFFPGQGFLQIQVTLWQGCATPHAVTSNDSHAIVFQALWTQYQASDLDPTLRELTCQMSPLEMPLLITAAPRTAPNHVAFVPLVYSGLLRFIQTKASYGGMPSGVLQALGKDT